MERLHTDGERDRTKLALRERPLVVIAIVLGRRGARVIIGKVGLDAVIGPTEKAGQLGDQREIAARARTKPPAP